ncbi:hypothetical protein BJ322DRAFT_1055884 [Thelephora terrestris]|uniref:Uncharacterized protein n=1 Tax=Thelephora terrestris TaxID=56493 RepID=A0A9P6L776_9AGAM|nr:hypothetical protein BJ322DRAFT_1055884 [Thelephora terrestris]
MVLTDPAPAHLLFSQWKPRGAKFFGSITPGKPGRNAGVTGLLCSHPLPFVEFRFFTSPAFIAAAARAQGIICLVRSRCPLCMTFLSRPLCSFERAPVGANGTETVARHLRGQPWSRGKHLGGVLVPSTSLPIPSSGVTTQRRPTFSAVRLSLCRVTSPPKTTSGVTPSATVHPSLDIPSPIDSTSTVTLTLPHHLYLYFMHTVFLHHPKPKRPKHDNTTTAANRSRSSGPPATHFLFTVTLERSPVKAQGYMNQWELAPIQS